MIAPLPKDFKATSPALAVGFVLTLFALVPAVSADSLTPVDYVLPTGTLKEYPLIGVQAGDEVSILVEVQNGPPVDFYFVNQTGRDQLTIGWPSPEQIDYLTEFSSINATSINKTVAVPTDEFYYLVIVNDNATQSAHVVGTIKTTTPEPALLITIAVILISVGAVVGVVVALVVRRSFRSRLSHYSPPGRPTPPNLAHQHMQAQRPALRQELDRPCPKCGSKNPKGTAACSHCGTQL